MAKVRLGDIATVVTKGTTPTTIGFQFEDSGINFVKIESISEDGTFLKEKFSHISDECNVQMRRSQLQENDILFSIAGAIGRSAIVTKEILPANTNQALAIIRVPKGKIDYNYLLYALSSSAINQQAAQHQQGVAQLNISLKNVSDFLLPIYTEAMQKRIVHNLKKIDKLISLRKQQLTKLDELVKARFVEMFGDLAAPQCEYPELKLVDICADADDIKCGPFGTQLNKDEYKTKGVAVWEIPQINSGFSEMPTHFITEEKAVILNAYSIEPGDIAMSRKGNVGKCGLFPENLKKGIIHSDVLRIRVDKRKVDSCFMMYQLHFSEAVKRQIEMVSSGAIMAGINVTKLKQIKVRIPELENQQMFAAFVERVDQQKQTVQQSLEKLELMKKVLMQEYFG